MVCSERREANSTPIPSDKQHSPPVRHIMGVGNRRRRMKHACRQERSTRLETQPRSGHCLVEGFEWPWRGSLITRREGEEIEGVCYKEEVGTHTKIGNEKRAPGMPEIKETRKGYNKDTQTRTRIRVTRRERGCVRKRRG
jgi:hypothetical protein